MPDTFEGERLLTEVGYDDELHSSQDQGEDDEHADALPPRRFQTVCAEVISLCKPIVASADGWLVSDDLAGEDAGCGGPGCVVTHGLWM